MASVLREGGTNPLEVKDWKDAVKLHLLNRTYDQRDYGLVENIIAYFDEEIDYIRTTWKHELCREDVILMLEEMIFLGWIEASEYKCRCCAKQNHNSREILKHVVRLKLTSVGYTKIHEHIFP